MELTKSEKQKMIDARLKEYQQKIFMFQMNYEALKAIGDEKTMEKTTKQIDALQRAYDAVKGMA